jgi:hypothetical protein
MNAR